MRAPLIVSALLLVASATAASPPEPVEFLDLGGPLRPRTWVKALGVSGDGSTVVGEIWDGSQTQAFVWTRHEGLIPIGDLPGGEFFSTAQAASHDGSVVVGTGSAEHGSQAFRWTRETGMTPLPRHPAGGTSFAHDVSADGNVIVGAVLGAGVYMQGVAWRDGGLTSFAERGIASLAAVSANGDTVAGYGFASDLGTYNGGYEGALLGPDGIVWTTGDFRPYVWHPESQITGLSPDGRIAVGRGNYVFGPEAFVWSREEGSRLFVEFETSYGGSNATDISADGSIIVGQVTWTYPTAYLHDRFRGTRSLQTVLERDHGVDLGGLFLNVTTGISDDGRTLVGYASLPDTIKRSWIAVLPPGCHDGLDNDADGLADFPADAGCRSEDDAWEPGRDDARILLAPWHKQQPRPLSDRKLLRVALLASETFDVEDVALDSLGLGPGAAAPVLIGERQPRRFDANGDGLLDLILHFPRRETGLTRSDHEACLQGDVDLVTFRACAALRAVPRPRDR